MAVYTDISDGDLESFLAAFDLGPAISFKGIAEGVENSNFLLETGRGRFILTVYERRVAEDDLPFFLALMEWMAERGFPSARPIADRTGARLGRIRGRPAAVISFLPGLAARRPTAAQCGQAGEGLAWLHRASEGFPGSRRNDLGQHAWAALFAGLEERADRLGSALAATIGADLQELARSWPADLPAGVIHADWFPDNVFFRDRIFAGAIDFYFAATDVLAYDLAIALNAWCFEPEGAFSAAKARALLAGYEQRRRLTRGERSALPVLGRGAAMRFFLTRLADWGEARPGALVRPRDPDEYRRKLDFHRAGGFAEIVSWP